LPVAQVEAGKLIPVVIKDKDGKEKTTNKTVLRKKVNFFMITSL